MIYIEPEILERVNSWLTPTFDQETQDTIKDLIATNPNENEGMYTYSCASCHHVDAGFQRSRCS